MEYKIISYSSSTVLANEITKHLKNGWSLAGGVAINVDSTGRHKYAQAITKPYKNG